MSTDSSEVVTGEWQASLSVDQVRRREGCTTSVINDLSLQLIEEINCLRPNTLIDFTGPNMSLGNAVFPYLQGQGPEDLQAAIRARGQNLSITSALRTLPQQYLLYTWWRNGQCGISLAARPGTSRHESGLAIDIDNYGAWRQTLTNHNFNWLGDSDPIHFDYAGPGTVDLRGLSVRAFQRLWNRNNPGDMIVEDGLYGPQTEGRITQSPAEGFPIGGCAPDEPEDMDMAVPPPPPPPPPVDMAVVIDATPVVDVLDPSDLEAPDSNMEENADFLVPSQDMTMRNDTSIPTSPAIEPREPDSGTRSGSGRQNDVEHVGGCAHHDPSSPPWLTLLACLVLLSARRRSPS